MDKEKIEYRRIEDIIPYERNPRKNDSAVDAVAASIREFGFKNPIIVDKDGVIIAGHTRLLAAKQLGMETVPCICADDLSEGQAKAFRLADNKTAELAEWDFELLDLELDEITDIDMSDFGFELNEEQPEQKERKSAAYTESVSVVIDCADDEEAERIYNELTEEGYQCHISTL